MGGTEQALPASRIPGLYSWQSQRECHWREAMQNCGNSRRDDFPSGKLEGFAIRQIVSIEKRACASRSAETTGAHVPPLGMKPGVGSECSRDSHAARSFRQQL